MSQFTNFDMSRCTELHKNYDCPWGGKSTIYSVPLDMLHLNVDNGRIASWVSGHERDPGTKKFKDMDIEEWNRTLIKFIEQSSSKEENKRTKDSLSKYGQLKVGAILSDGTVVAGNRRCSLLMSLLEETGDYDRFGYFKCAIFDVPDTEEGRKQLKRLETKTQYGEDTPVAYGPIERLVDIYNNVIAEGHPYSPSEYANFLQLKKSQIENLKTRANILVDYLEYLGKPGNYEIARVEKLDGPINELATLHKKISERDWNEIKNVFYKAMKDTSGDRTRIIRKQVKVYLNNPSVIYDLMREQDNELLGRDASNFGIRPRNEEPATSNRSLDDRINTEVIKIEITQARTKPISYVNDAIAQLKKFDRSDIEIMKPEEKRDFFQRIDALIRLAQRFTKDRFEK